MGQFPDYASKRFLIVDDEVFMLGSVERMLKQCHAALILKASDGAKALRSITDDLTQVDCVISDFNMKPVNGLQLLQGIRLGINPKIPRDQPFILLTGNTDADVAEAATALHVNEVLMKPVTPEKLYQTIDKVFGRSIALKGADQYRSIKLPVG